jgi:hypothetical protein
VHAGTASGRRRATKREDTSGGAAVDAPARGVRAGGEAAGADGANLNKLNVPQYTHRLLQCPGVASSHAAGAGGA